MPTVMNSLRKTTAALTNPGYWKKRLSEEKTKYAPLHEKYIKKLEAIDTLESKQKTVLLEAKQELKRLFKKLKDQEKIISIIHSKITSSSGEGARKKYNTRRRKRCRKGTRRNRKTGKCIRK